MALTPSQLPLRLGLCSLAALLVCLSFPNFLQKTLHPPFAFFAWFALVPFFMALKGATPRQGAFLGYSFGFLHLGGILYWIALLEEARYLSFPAWLALVGYLSLYFGLFGFLFAWIRGRSGISPGWLAPVLWVALEFFRGTRPWGGFSWGELGYSQAPYPLVLQFTTLLGIHGLTFLMVWFNAALWELFEEIRSLRGQSGAGPAVPAPGPTRQVLVRSLLPLVVLLLALGWGEWRVLRNPSQGIGTALLLQPSIDQSQKWSQENERETYRILGALAEALVSRKPGLIVWPETAAPAYLLSSPKPLTLVTGSVRKTSLPHLVGCLHQEYAPADQLFQYNAAVAFDAKGKAEGFYGKRHLVPFGEFVPFQEYLTFLGPVVGDLGSFSRGPGYKVFRAEGFSYTPMICYEAVFPGDVREASRTGAQVLVNISNDAWYGRTASAYQHAMMAVAACAGVGKPLLRSANTGISLATDPFGKVLASTDLFDRTALSAEVRVNGLGPTPYERWGDWLALTCWALSFLLVLLAVRKGTHGKI